MSAWLDMLVVSLWSPVAKQLVLPGLWVQWRPIWRRQRRDMGKSWEKQPELSVELFGYVCVSENGRFNTPKLYPKLYPRIAIWIYLVDRETDDNPSDKPILWEVSTAPKEMEDMDVFIHIKQMTLHYLATKKWKIWI